MTGKSGNEIIIEYWNEEQERWFKAYFETHRGCLMFSQKLEENGIETRANQF